MKRCITNLLTSLAASVVLALGAGGTQAAEADPQVAPPAPPAATTTVSSATTLVGQDVQSVLGNYLPQGPYFGQIGKPHCGHVLDLLLHNCFRKQLGVDSSAAPQVLVHSGPHVFLGLAPGDLALVSVDLIAEGLDECGPTYQVTFHNNSKVDICNFQISLVAAMCHIQLNSPCTTVHVEKLCAGETGIVQVQMPAACLTMGPAGQEAAIFDTLIVAIDSYDELVECNELNNVAVLKRAEITVLVTEAQPAETAEVVPTENVAAPEQTPVPTPSDKTSPLDNFDLDKLDLDDQEGAALFSKR